MIRKIDELGRVCLPKEYRKELGIEEYDELKMELVDRKIIISKVDDIDYKAIVEKALNKIWEIHEKTFYDEIYVLDTIEEILKGEDNE